MALTWTHTLVKTNDVGVFTFNNTTVYGTGGNPLRSDGAEKLIVAHVTEDNIEEFITVDSTPYLSATSYTINNTKDGHYHFEILRFDKWALGTYNQIEVRDGNDIITTYAQLIYGVTMGKFYKLIAAATDIEPGVTSGWETYWEEVTDFTDEEIRNNDTIEVAVFDDIHDARATICTKNELYKVSCADPSCTDVKSYLPYLKRAILLAGARAKRDDSQSEKSETILRNIENLCGQC